VSPKEDTARTMLHTPFHLGLKILQQGTKPQPTNFDAHPMTFRKLFPQGQESVDGGRLLKEVEGHEKYDLRH
jgi:hypothetical protein